MVYILIQYLIPPLRFQIWTLDFSGHRKTWLFGKTEVTAEGPRLDIKTELNPYEDYYSV